MGRAYPELPVVGVGAVVGFGDKVLLARRGQPPGQGRWSLPGGTVELGETLHQAVAREVMEETGLAVQAGPLLEVLEMIIPDEHSKIQYHYILFDYFCQAQSTAAVAGDDAAQVAWFDLDECRSLDMWSETLRIIEKALALPKAKD